jgi:predicted ATPase/signal transduction histidine kinase
MPMLPALETLLPGYDRAEIIHQGSTTTIYRAYGRESAGDRPSVILKTLNGDYPTPQCIAQLHHEADILRDLAAPIGDEMGGTAIGGIVGYLGLENYQQRPYLILEDIAGTSLKTHLAQHICTDVALGKTLALMLNLTETVGALHERQIIHKDINPANILLLPNQSAAKLIDFGIAARLHRNTPNGIKTNILEGTLAYIAPEQTGRMNRAIDHRADFYALGATFYELLTGQVPFSVQDAVALVHCHIAQQPIPPHQINSSIPVALSDIVLKLLAKTVDDRYQSAYGLAADLRHCLETWHRTETIVAFPLGQRDRSTQWQVSQSLYGRTAEVMTLTAALQRCTPSPLSESSSPLSSASCPSEVVLIRGQSGVGKSFLVQTLKTAPRAGYWIAGRFEPLKHNTPYLPLIQAFQDLIRQILTESEAQVRLWRERLRAALGSNGQLIIDVIPEVELLLGSQPVVSPLETVEAQNRFQWVFQEFMGIFAQAAHPVILYLDDLQWADAASMQMIQRLVSERAHWLLIGTYRDSEPNDILQTAIAQIETAGIPLQLIHLQPLSFDCTVQFICDTLACTKSAASSLAAVVFHRTRGNPFFIKQLLDFLYQEKLLNFDFSQGQWTWDIDRIQSLGLTDDIIQLISERIQKLSEKTQHILKIAACIGSLFDLETLAVVSKIDLPDLNSSLWESLREGLILSLDAPTAIAAGLSQAAAVGNGGYRFLHDRIQQAAYSLIALDDRQTLHLAVGRFRLSGLQTSHREDSLFDTVNQLNLGQDLITPIEDRLELAQLNLLAGQKAKAAVAYDPALKYFTVGTDLLPKNSWQTHHALAVKLYMERAEAAYLCGKFAEADYFFDVVLHHGLDPMLQADVYTTKMALSINQNRYLEAIDLAKQGLQLLQMPLPLATTTEVDRAIAALQTRLADKTGSTILALAEQPPMTEPTRQRALKILQYLAAAAIRCDRALYNLAIVTMVQISLDYGHTPNSAYAYVAYGTILGSGLGDYATGHQFGQLALQISTQFQALEGITKFSFGGFLGHWQEPLRRCKLYLAEAFQHCYEQGDLLYGLYSLALLVDATIMGGESLATAAADSKRYLEFALQRQYTAMINDALIKHQFILSLQGKTKNNTSFSDTIHDEANLLKALKQPTEPKNALSRYTIYKAQSLYLFGEYATAWEMIQESDALVECHYGVVIFAEHYFYHALILLAVWPQAMATDAAAAQQQLARDRAKLQQWAAQGPANFLHRQLLVEAEVARVEGDHLVAMERYDQAIAAARTAEFIQNEAIACERAAQYYHQQGRTRIATAYLIDARTAYSQWGATAKVQAMEQAYGSARTPLSASLSTLHLGETVVAPPTTALDWLTVIRASQTLSSEIVFTRLMEKLMKIAVENAGAQRGVLLSRRGTGLVDGATGSTKHGTAVDHGTTRLTTTGDRLRDRLTIEVEGQMEQQQVVIASHVPLTIWESLPLTVINYVDRTQEHLVLDRAQNDGRFVSDPYLLAHRVQSVLCMPIRYQGKLTGILYLENNLVIGAFTPDRLEVLKLLTSQVSISMENANLYGNLQTYSRELEARNADLQQSQQQFQSQAHQLEQALNSLKNTQTQLVQTEKMSSLGQLVAGVAHEINNPVHFVSGNISCAQDYIFDLLNLLHLYQEHYPQPVAEIQAAANTVDLDFLSMDLPKLLNSMAMGIDRIHNIVLSLRNFSRMDESVMKPVDLHEGLESTLMILQLRLKATKARPAITVTKEYGMLPLVECYGGQVNQVFMNLLANAIDALDDQCEQRRFAENRDHPSQIQIRTEVIEDNWIAIRIRDNGPGIAADARQRLFETFFTTKPEGKGTGLGLSISHQIITQKHQGRLYCHSEVGGGAEFVIELPICQELRVWPVASF